VQRGPCIDIGESGLRRHDLSREALTGHDLVSQGCLSSGAAGFGQLLMPLYPALGVLRYRGGQAAGVAHPREARTLQPRGRPPSGGRWLREA
jgi:hypothetical protein